MFCSASNDWGYEHVPSQVGKIVLITGANQGLGKALVGDFINTDCEKIILACRNEERAKEAMSELGGDPRMQFLHLDLGDLASVRAAAAKLKTMVSRIDTLVLNAGIFHSDGKKVVTKDGFEDTMGSCHFGHFLFTAEVWPLIKQSKLARIVPVSSIAHTWTKTGLDLDDLHWQTREYDANEAYFQAKLANVYFSRELTRRCKSAGLTITSVTLSPGFGDSGLYRDAPWYLRPILNMCAESNEKLSINSLRAATDLGLTEGEYLSPKRMNFYGPPAVVPPSDLALDADKAATLWAKSEEIVGRKFVVA